MLSKKRKYEEENRSFKSEWESEFYLWIKTVNLCLLCKVTLAQFKAPF